MPVVEPQIQYVTTSDGVSIAYYAIGQGPATLFLMSPWSHLEAEWRIDMLRMAYIAFAQRSTLVRLDPRGLGLSDRDPPDFKLDSMVLDIEAVVDRLGLDDVRILAAGGSNLPGLAYTARHPDKVTHLAQMPPAASGNDMTNDRLQKVSDLAIVDWELGSETLIRTLYPEFGDEQAKEFADLLRTSLDQQGFGRNIEWTQQWNADADAASMSTPTLLIHMLNHVNFNLPATRRVAGLIKDSRVAFVDSAAEGLLLAQRFFEGDIPDLTGPASVQTATLPDAAALRTVLFTDVEGSTALTERLGDAKARDLLREHERLIRAALNEHGGSEVKTMGDGFMAFFTSASKALECAIAIQSAFAKRNESAEEPIKVRVGLNAGEPISENDDLFGTAVNEAARITSTAEGGEILVAGVVRDLTKGKDFLFNDRGETSLRGFEDPVRLFEVSWQE
jgi:class 3 adenylate cyclase